MKTLSNQLSKVIIVSLMALLISCGDDDDGGGPTPTGDSKQYTLNAVAEPSISGTATFAELSDGSTSITLQLVNTPAGGSHPAHIHANTAAEGGGIDISLEPVDGNTGSSITIVSTTDAGDLLSYEDLLDYDGYINVHLSESDLATLVAQGDIGQNELTGSNEEYELGAVSDPEISGTATFYERRNEETLVVIELENTPSNGDHPSHIHLNTAAEGGGIAISLTNVNGSTGISKTNVTALDDATSINYEALIDFDGYINVHLSESDLATLVAQGDIGQNKLTGNSEEYELGSVSDPEISGIATFYERRNEETLVVIELENTPSNGDHPSHIHLNTAVEGGGIAISLTNVNGSTGISKTNVTALDDATSINYEALIDFDGYINVHLSETELATLVAQGDIGQNALTGVSETYVLEERDVAGVSGSAIFYERKNGETLVVISLSGGTIDGDHPTHIHEGSATNNGPIAIDLTSVDSDGKSKTNVTQLNAGAAISYDELVDFTGYINVHLSADNLASLVAQGNIGASAN